MLTPLPPGHTVSTRYSDQLLRAFGAARRLMPTRADGEFSPVRFTIGGTYRLRAGGETWLRGDELPEFDSCGDEFHAEFIRTAPAAVVHTLH